MMWKWDQTHFGTHYFHPTTRQIQKCAKFSLEFGHEKNILQKNQIFDFHAIFDNSALTHEY